MKVAGWPFWVKALEMVRCSRVLVTADDVRACVLEYKLCTTDIFLPPSPQSWSL